MNIPDDRRNDIVPCTQNYPVEEVMLDLLHLAAVSLRMYVLFICVLVVFHVINIEVHIAMDMF